LAEHDLAKVGVASPLPDVRRGVSFLVQQKSTQDIRGAF